MTGAAATAQADGVVVAPSPKAAARVFCGRLFGPGRYRAEALHEYTDEAGRPLFWRIRARLPSGDKQIRPMRPEAGGYALGEPPFNGRGRPLYRLHELAAAPGSATIWFVEGESCTDALVRVGLIATTAGSATSDERADFEPLRGRRVIVWPDNDDAGRAHGARVAAKLRALNCTVEVVDIGALDLPLGGDVVDWLRMNPHATAADIERLPRRRAEPTAAAAEPQRRGPEVEQSPALDPAALYGLAGDIVRMIDPDTEADPVAILIQTLVAFGALVGRGPHYAVEGDQHHANLYALLVGETSRGRKGTSWGRVRQIFERVPDWPRVVDGLSSGEGLKWAVRDPIRRVERDQKTGYATEVETDPGVADKRLLVIEPEFAQSLRQCQRAGNTLSPTVRCAWDSGRLMTLTKHDPVTATGVHVSIVGHVTADELRAELTNVDAANGFANRFLFVHVKRSKVLPFGGRPLPDDAASSLAARIAHAAALARTRGAIAMTDAARGTWSAIYPTLSAGYPGLFGAVTARAEAQCVRLALVYALLDGADRIDKAHLLAALAVWEYAEGSARLIFGDALGDPVADEILRALRAAGDRGMTRTELRDLFGRNRPAERIAAALELLARRGLAVRDTRPQPDGGRPAEVWRCGR